MALSKILENSITDGVVSAAKLKDFAAAVDLNGVELILDASGNATLGADLSIGDDLTILGGLIDLKSNSGSPSQIKFYCESSNAHAQTLTAQVHSVSANNTLTLPAGGNSTLVSETHTQTLTNKTLTSPNINSPTITTLTATALNLTDASIVFEGATADAHETTLTVTDPTADRTITLPNETGTLITSASAATNAFSIALAAALG